MLCHAVQVDAGHVGIGAKLGDYQGNVPGEQQHATTALCLAAPSSYHADRVDECCQRPQQSC